MTDSFLDLSAVELSRRVASREVSAREMMTVALDRIEKVNPTHNAIVALREREELMEEAGERDDALVRGDVPAGRLHGFPHAVKDTAMVKGMRTTFGSPLLAESTAPVDAYFVERLRAAGVVIIGRTNVPEMGLGSHTYNPVYGTTGNAVDPGRTAGGSSGGAAVAVARGMVPVADGSDYMGSLRNPAGWNGIVSLRPTIGVVPLGPSDDLMTQQLVTEGPMARSVADLGLLLSVMAGPDRRVPASRQLDPSQFTHVSPANPANLRLGWLDDVAGRVPTEPGVVETCRGALEACNAAGAAVDDVSLGVGRDEMWATYLALRHTTSAGAATVGATSALLARPGAYDKIKDEMKWEIDGGRDVSAIDVYAAWMFVSRLRSRFLELFETFDAVVLPTAQCFPFPTDWTWPSSIDGVEMDTYHRWMEIAVPATLTGLPVLTLPGGRGPDGLPIGLQMIGAPGTDRALLDLGAGLEPALAGL